jgi:DNA-directed RNA polymerase specialized sigma subunit
MESIAQAIVTVKRAMKAGVIEKEKYKQLEDYLNQRAKGLKLKKSDIAKAKRNLEDELEAEVEEFFMDEDDALYKMAEDILEDFVDEEDDEMLRKEEQECKVKDDDWKKQEDAIKAWANMNNEEREVIALLARKWQMSR